MNFKRTAALVATTTTVLAAAGCGTMPGTAQTGMTKAGTYNAAAKRRAEKKGGTWTILVHMSAENNLYRFGLEDLNEMEAGAPEGSDINVYVLFDGIKNGDSAIYKVKRDTGMNTTIISEKVDATGVIPSTNEIDSGSVETGVKFLEWAAKNAKADHTMIAYWDHGSGVFAAGNPITKSFGHDDAGTHMNTNDLDDLGAAFHKAAGKPLSVVSFDACLMAHGEIAYQLKGNADYLVASEELEPGKGWDYNLWLKAAAQTDRTPAAMTSALVDTYAKSYGPGGTQSSGRDQITLSSTDVNAFNANVVPALDNFVAAANRSMTTDKAMFQAARAKAQVFYNKDCADLGSFLNNVKATSRNAEVTRAAEDLSSAYKSSIVREVKSSHFPGASGLVLYFPTPTQRFNPVYDDASKIAFSATGWKNFLKSYR